jgi:hypothetical protein
MSDSTALLLIEPGAASLAVAGDELIGPLSGAVTPQPLPWSTGSTVVVDEPSHQSMVICTLLADLSDDAIEVVVSLVPASGPDQPQPVVRFAQWSEHGTELLAYVPSTDVSGTAAPFTLRIAATHIAPDGTRQVLSANDAAAAIRLDLVQGVLGRLTAVLLSEKSRLRRQARELRAMRALDEARADALDRMGADLGCPRFADQIKWDLVGKQVGTVPLTPPGTVEDDGSYRARLRILRGVRLPSPTWIDSAVNGPGKPADPGAGWLADVGFAKRLTVDEAANPLRVTFRLISSGHPKGRMELLNAIRLTHLVWPAGSAPGNAAHGARMITPEVKLRIDAARVALKSFGLPANQPVAASVAFAVKRLADRQTALGVQVFGTLIGGQQDGGGSRYELGLGANFKAPKTFNLNKAVTKAQKLADPGLVPVSSANDPIGAWLLKACGFRTAELLPDGSVYVSCLATGGLIVDVTPGPDAAAPLMLAARLETANDATHDAPLAGVVAALAADGLAPVAAPAPLLAGIKPTSSNAGIATALTELGLPVLADAAAVTDVKTRMAKVDNRTYVAFDLGGGNTTAIKNDPSKLAAILGQAARGGASSGLPVMTSSGTLALILGIADLPRAGNNLASQHTVAYRWQIRGLAGQGATMWPRIGASAKIANAGEGISIVTCLAYVRDGHNDPYEWRPTLETGALLSLRQYEHLMNVIEIVTPLGVRADTWSIRREHVDVDGSNSPTPLPASAARTYRRYRPLHS